MVVEEAVVVEEVVSVAVEEVVEAGVGLEEVEVEAGDEEDLEEDEEAEDSPRAQVNSISIHVLKSRAAFKFLACMLVARLNIKIF